MATRTITVHDCCTVPECGKALPSIAEGERGTCSRCWLKHMPVDTRKAMYRAFRAILAKAPAAEKNAAVRDAAAKLDRDEAAQVGT